MVQLIQLWWSDSYEKVSSQGCGCASFPISCCMVLPKQVWNLRQQMKEIVTRYFTVILPNTMISFWNISTVSAPIQPQKLGWSTGWTATWWYSWPLSLFDLSPPGRTAAYQTWQYISVHETCWHHADEVSCIKWNEYISETCTVSSPVSVYAYTERSMQDAGLSSLNVLTWIQPLLWWWVSVLSSR